MASTAAGCPTVSSSTLHYHRPHSCTRSAPLVGHCWLDRGRHQGRRLAAYAGEASPVIDRSPPWTNRRHCRLCAAKNPVGDRPQSSPTIGSSATGRPAMRHERALHRLAIVEASTLLAKWQDISQCAQNHQAWAEGGNVRRQNSLPGSISQRVADCFGACQQAQSRLHGCMTMLLGVAP
jgi:hypothetical protein